MGKTIFSGSSPVAMVVPEDVYAAQQDPSGHRKWFASPSRPSCEVRHGATAKAKVWSEGW